MQPPQLVPLVVPVVPVVLVPLVRPRPQEPLALAGWCADRVPGSWNR